MKKQGKTYRELKAKLETLTDEQLGMEIVWCGEDRGGPIFGFEILKEDHINPSGDGMEPVSQVRKSLIEDEDMTEEEAQREIDSEGVVGRKGQLLLLVDDMGTDPDETKE